MNDNLQKASKGDALESLKLNSGYKVLIEEIIYPLYEDAWFRLREKEDLEARAILKAIDEIIARIDDQINLGKMAREEYRKELAKHMQMTS